MGIGQVARVRVPFVDLAPVHDDLRQILVEDFAELVASGALTNGPHVRAFEDAFAHYCGAPHAVGVGSGLDALRLGLLASGIEQGDEVIVPAHTFVATVEAVGQAGGRPVLADISAADFALDVDAVEEAVTGRTRFILPVHLYGQMADMRALSSLARRVGATIVEDACQAHGARRDDLAAGTVGAVGAFSFYPGKNLGAVGDAGALVTVDEAVASRVRMLREHGQSAKYMHDVEGWTSRLDTIQAAVLLRKLPRLDRWNAARREAAELYREALSGVGDLVLPRTMPGSEHVWHLYVVRTANPEALARFLGERGVSTGRHYPVPIHLTAAYASLGYAKGAFVIAEAVAMECLSLPIFPGITQEQVATVCDLVGEFFASGAYQSR